MTPRMDGVELAQVPPSSAMRMAAMALPEERDPVEVCHELIESLRRRGWAVRPWPERLEKLILWWRRQKDWWLARAKKKERLAPWTSRRSTTVHPLRIIFVRRTFTGTDAADAALINHEDVHTRQPGGGWFAGLWWTIKMILRYFRLSQELEAESHEAGMRALLGERVADLAPQLDPLRCPRVEGWTLEKQITHVRRRSIDLREEAAA